MQRKLFVTFLANFLGKSLNPVPSIALFSMMKMSAVQSALQASKLLHGYLGEEAELPTWSYSQRCVGATEIDCHIFFSWLTSWK
jgi:hypothetical protein